MALESSEKVYLGNHKLVVKTAWGGHLVVPSFNLDVALGAVRDGMIEAWTTKMVQAILKPGDTYLNAGANFGYYIALGGHLTGISGRVYAVEPNPHIFPFLMNTIYWNGTPSQTRLYNRALADRAGIRLEFSFDPQYLGGGSSGIHLSGTSQGNSARRQFNRLEDAVWSADNLEVLTTPDGRVIETSGLMVGFEATTTTIDEVCKESAKVDLIHLDIEGAEAFALAGAVNTINRSEGIKFITEWSGQHHYANAGREAQENFADFWKMLSMKSYVARRIETSFTEDGRVELSKPLGWEHLTTNAVHGDYVWAHEADEVWKSDMVSCSQE
jgi:FkbM family methyltransferase